jgi:hypothetical protein
LVTEAMVQGYPVTAYADGPVSAAVRGIWAQVREELLGTRTD